MPVLKTIAPKSQLLQKYIDGFYVFSSISNEGLSYLAFPHTNTGLSIFKGASIERSAHRMKITGQQTNNPTISIEILGKYTKPVWVTYEGIVDEIAIIFKPLGINRFIREDLIIIAGKYTQPLVNDLWLHEADNVFRSDDRIASLEQFLLSVFEDKAEYQQLEKALTMLGSNDVVFSISDVAERLNMNLKTFQRSFKRNITCSPSEYKRIARFRNSLNTKMLSNESKSLTSVTYENNYSDQSYFIKEFRKLTNQNPKLFFKEASLIDGDKLIWEIL